MTNATEPPAAAGLLTIASGPDRYVDFANSLAASLRAFGRWDGEMAVVTDRDASTFNGLFDHVIDIRNFAGTGVEQKLSLDLMTPFSETLFVDCDCLAFRPLGPTVARFRISGEAFGALAGHHVGPGDEHYALNDVSGFLRSVGIDRLPAFNSGMLWWTSDGRRIFEDARLIASTGSVEFVHAFKGARLADEPLLGAAMQRLGVDFALPRSEHMVPTAAVTSLKGIDVVRGRSTVQTAAGTVSPAVLHFNYSGQASFLYARERLRARRSWLAPGIAGSLVAPAWVRAHGRAALSRQIRRRKHR